MRASYTEDLHVPGVAKVASVSEGSLGRRVFNWEHVLAAVLLCPRPSLK